MGHRIGVVFFAFLFAFIAGASPRAFSAPIDVDSMLDGVYIVNNYEGTSIKLVEVLIDRTNAPREVLVTSSRTETQPIIVGRFDETTFERQASGYLLVKLSPSINPRISKVETGFGSHMRVYNDPARGAVAAFLVSYPEELAVVPSQDYIKMLFDKPNGKKGEKSNLELLKAAPILNNINGALRLDFCLPLQMAQVQGPTQVIVEIATDVGAKSYAFTVGAEGLYLYRAGQFPEPVYKLATWQALKTEAWWAATFTDTAVKFVVEGLEWEGPVKFRQSTDLRYLLATDSGDTEVIKALAATQSDSRKGLTIEAALDGAEILPITKVSAGMYTVDWRGLYYTAAYKTGAREWLLTSDSIIWTPIVVE